MGGHNRVLIDLMTCPSITLESLNMPAPLNLADAPLPTSLLARGFSLSIAVRTCLLEGPAFDGRRATSSSATSSATESIGLTPDGALSIFRTDSGRTNGNTFDAHGLLISCEGAEFGTGGRRRLVRTDLKTGMWRS